MNYKERPKCRLVIQNLLDNGLTLKTIAHNSIYFSTGLKIQARKMLKEAQR